MIRLFKASRCEVEDEMRMPCSAEEMVIRHVKWLRGEANRLCLNPADADDLIDKVIQKCFSEEERFYTAARFKGWVKVEMENLYHTFITRQQSGANTPEYVCTEESYRKLLVDKLDEIKSMAQQNYPSRMSSEDFFLEVIRALLTQPLIRRNEQDFIGAVYCLVKDLQLEWLMRLRW